MPTKRNVLDQIPIVLSTLLLVATKIEKIAVYLIDPLYRFIFVVSGIMLSGIYMYRMLRTEVPKSGLILPPGTQQKRVPVYSRRFRLIAVMAFFTTIAFGSYLFFTGNIFSIAEASQIDWIGGHGIAVADDGNSYQLVHICDSQQPDLFDIGRDSATISFRLSKERRFKSVCVDNLIVEVIRFAPSAARHAVFGAKLLSANLYYVEVNDPNTARTNAFFASPYIVPTPNNRISSQAQKLGYALISTDEPQPFVLRINARRPGLYVLRVLAELSANGSKQRLVIEPNKAFLFQFNENPF